MPHLFHAGFYAAVMISNSPTGQKWGIASVTVTPKRREAPEASQVIIINKPIAIDGDVVDAFQIVRALNSVADKDKQGTILDALKAIQKKGKK